MFGSEPRAPEDAVETKDPFVFEILCERYRVDACIGRGGMGVVYRGTHLSLGKQVAIKRLDIRLSKDSTAFERFRREAIAACRVDSPHVVQVFDWGMAADDSPFIVMELLEGLTLRSFLEQEGRLLVPDAARITLQILRGLGHIHHAEILHRDLKPENVFLCEYLDQPTFVKLLDFGISKQLGSEEFTTKTSTQAGVILGTASYLSPEQAQGDPLLAFSSDLYSVGAILFEMLTGQPPHRGRTYEATLVDTCTRDADDVRVHCPLIKASLAEIVGKALKREPTLRYATCAEFQRALLAALPELVDTSLNSTSTPPPRERMALPSTRRRNRLAAISAGALLLLGSAGWLSTTDGLGVRGNVRVVVPAVKHGTSGDAQSSPRILPQTVPQLKAKREGAREAGTLSLLPLDSGKSGVPAASAVTIGSPATSSLPRLSVSPTHPRLGSPPALASSAPAPPTGVLGGLQLRRTMP